MEKVRPSGRRITFIHLLFFCSGFPALIYQIVWQRALFAICGLNIESVQQQYVGVGLARSGAQFLFVFRNKH